MSELARLRSTIIADHGRSEDAIVEQLRQNSRIDTAIREAAQARALNYVKSIRNADDPGLMEVFLAEYGLSTDEGIALMCLAEALLRVPDSETMDTLIEDKIAPSDWSAHLGKSSSTFVNGSTWALMLTGKVLDDHGKGIAATLRGAIKRVGEPVIRVAARRAMQELGGQFVLGETIDEAVERGRRKARQGYTFSYDMLGEAALTAEDAKAFFAAYADAIQRLAKRCTSQDIRDNPGISVKLSALHPRYEQPQAERVMEELVPRLLQLARMAKAVNMGFNIDAEEADRLELSLDVIEATLRDPSLAGWDGFGVVVQAYGKRAASVIDWLHALAVELDRRLMVRLVKGAYWDTEIKRAQVESLAGFPVLTRKAATDLSYLCCAEKLLGFADRLYPQFATHNAHSVATILEMARDHSRFEFQRLHGMGEALHDLVLAQGSTRCRIYAPVGAHRDLLAYLVRRLLENGANSSFVNQIVNKATPPEVVAADPFDAPDLGLPNPAVTQPSELFAPERRNSRGTDLHHRKEIAGYQQDRAPYADKSWQAGPVVAGDATADAAHAVRNPARPDDIVGEVAFASAADVEVAYDAARIWQASADDRACVLARTADLYEQRQGELVALLAREAGKTAKDSIAELREAVDFLRYYGAGAEHLDQPPCGRFVCISPWNFPLAIFTGQIAAALAAGNAVLAKPAESTSLIAAVAVAIFHDAGVPRSALQLLPGTGAEIGAALVSDRRLDGVAFTGSTATAKAIDRAITASRAKGAPLIAETGGLNAMIVDSTALPEQAIKDVVASAFQSAGQRCSALRLLYLQRDIAKDFTEMLIGAMNEQRIGDPWDLSTDIGPVIDDTARQRISGYVAEARSQGRVVHELDTPQTGNFVAPTLIRLSGIEALESEIFGPILHLATFEADEIDTVVDAINAKGFGLTFGLHTRIDSRVQRMVDHVHAGNIYVNRNQIGAVVGSQPFGGEGLSGTGPKAGGPNYLRRFVRPRAGSAKGTWQRDCDVTDLGRRLKAVTTRPVIDRLQMPGPTGEANTLTLSARPPLLCLGPGEQAMTTQIREVEALGGIAVGSNGHLPAASLRHLDGFGGVIWWGADAADYAHALAERLGPILPLIVGLPDIGHVAHERHLCVDTTAAGGNASLLAG